MPSYSCGSRGLKVGVRPSIASAAYAYVAAVVNAILIYAMRAGFVELSQADQITLIQQGSFELIFARYTSLFSEEGMFLPDMSARIPRLTSVFLAFIQWIYTTTTVLWILSGATRLSRYQKGKTRKVKPIWIYRSKR